MVMFYIYLYIFLFMQVLGNANIFGSLSDIYYLWNCNSWKNIWVYNNSWFVLYLNCLPCIESYKVRIPIYICVYIYPFLPY